MVAGHAAAWLRQVDEHPAVLALRADSGRTMAAIAGRLAARIDRRTGTVTITWAELQQAAGVGRSTVAVWLAWLREHGLLATVHGGATGPAGNIAPCYLPLIPAPAVGGSVDQHRTPSVGRSIERSQPSRERLSTARTGLAAGGRRSARHQQGRAGPRYAPDRLPHPKSRRHARYALAAALMRTRPLLFGYGRCRLSALAHAVRHVAAAGWSAADVLALLDGPDALPVPTGPEETSTVRHPARWVAYRLAGAEHTQRPTAAAAAAQARAEHERRTQLAERRAHLAAETAAAVPLTAAAAAGDLAALRAHLAARLPPRDRLLRRRGLGP